MLNKKIIAYAHDLKVLGAVGAINYLENTITLVTKEKELHTADLDDTTILEHIGAINGKHIFNHDVLSGLDTNSVNGQEVNYEIELVEGGVQFHKLDGKLNRVKTGVVIPLERLDKLPKGLKLVGNLFELKDALPKVDFNIKIVKDFSNGEFTYFYACNNKFEEQIDLIKVIFVGHQILEEENYARVTLSYEVYQDSVNAGTLKEVSPQELLNYVTGVTYGKTVDPTEDIEGYEEEDYYDDEEYEDEEDFYEDEEDFLDEDDVAREVCGCNQKVCDCELFDF